MKINFLQTGSRVLFYILFAVSIAVTGAGKMELSESEMDLESRLVKIASKWQLLIKAHDIREPSGNENDRITWIPEMGIRGKYLYLKNVINIRVLEGVTGHRVFIKGPHGDEPDWISRDAFGYYNPEFLSSLKNILVKVSDNPNLVRVFGNYYNHELKTLVRTFLRTYNSKNIHDELIEKYIARIRGTDPDDEANNPAEVLYDKFYKEASRAENSGFLFYEYATCCGFWVRRKIDQTDKHFLRIFTLVAEIFDSEYMETQNKMNMPGE